MKSSEKQFVDTNIFIYTLFKVDSAKHQACIGLFEEAAQGKVKLWTSQWVIAEVVWFLTRKRMSWERIRSVVEKIIQTRGLEVADKDVLFEVMKECESGEDFVDGLNVVLAKREGINLGYSYDKGLGKRQGFKRLEP